MDKASAVIDPKLAKLVVEQMNCLVITDTEGKYLYANRAWEELMKLRFSDVKDKYVRDVVMNSKIDVALKQRKTLTGQSKVSTGGAEQDVFSIYMPVFDSGELIAGLIFTIITGNDRRDYLEKVQSLIDEMRYYKSELSRIRGAKYSIDNIVGDSLVMLALKEDIQRASRSNSTVLIEGETGSGKELVAHAIHDLSRRTFEPFVKVNCASIPEELLESEFFGYDQGAFTGANRRGQPGKFEQANCGSIFLDEISQLSMHLQPKFLRVLQEKEIERLGGTKSIPIDVRVIASSNVSLESMVNDKKFRSDLFYRLNVLTIKIPPLRERAEDIPQLADHLVDRLNFRLGLHVPPPDMEIKLKLMEYSWPGNVRELQNVLERAMNASYGERLKWEHFADYFESRSRLMAHREKDAAPKRRHAKTEKEQIEAALRECKSKSEAARRLGYSRTTLYKKLEKYGIEA